VQAGTEPVTAEEVPDRVDRPRERILEATPPSFAGWDSMADAQLLQSLKPSAAAVEGMRNVLQQQVETLRKRGASWADIGAALGVSRQAAWERFS